MISITDEYQFNTRLIGTTELFIKEGLMLNIKIVRVAL